MTKKYAERCVFIETKDTKQAYRINWQDLHDSFKKNYQLNSNYEISLTLTRAKGYEKVFDAAQAKCGVMYAGQWYNIQQREPKLDEQGFLTMQVTCTHTLVDMLKNVRIDPQEPTEQNPDKSGNDSSSDDSSSDDNPQPGTVIKRTAEQQLTTLDACMHKFLDNNNQGVKYELHGNFPQVAIECTGSLYEWLNSNLKTFSAYWIPDGYTVKIYDLASLRHQTGRQLRYMYNINSVDIQENDTSIVNDCWVYGGKVEADTTTVSGGGNGITEPQNGDWTPVIKNAASLTGQQLSDSDIALVKAQINLESSGREDAKGGDDGLSDGIAKGLLQFKQATFNYYCRPPYTNIWHGLDQLIALFNVPNWRNQITGRHGWSPFGAPVSKAQITALSATSTGRSQQIIDYCKSFVGKVPYVWGGSTPSGWDCSGFVCYVLNHFGINTPRTNTVGLEGKGTIVNPPYQTGDLLFWGARGGSYHVSIAMDSTWRVGADNYQDGTVYRTIASLPPQFAVRVPGFADGNVNSGSSDDSTTTTTTSASYYSLVYHYQDQDSIKKYGLHCGAPITMDSIYDMNALKTYVENTVQHNPEFSLTVSNVDEQGYQLGDVVRLIVPTMNINTDMTLVGIEGNDNILHPHADKTLTFNNTGLAMKDVNIALFNAIKDTNANVQALDIFGGTGARKEDHFANENNKKSEQSVIIYNEAQIKQMEEINNSVGR